MEERRLSVTQLNNYIKGVFDDELVLKNITVYGEVFECNQASGKTFFMTLKDDKTILHCVCFGSVFPPKVGDTVAVKGSVEYYPKGNRISFVVENIAYFGKGKINEALLALKAKLQEEGLFDNKRPLPPFVKKLAVVTSETGAVIHDILSVLKKGHQYIDVTIYPVKVQGDGAESVIVSAIKKANERKMEDAIIVARGGGSGSDLLAFNTEEVARAVATSEIPIISAVGHETDYTLCDFCATVRAGTPSIAAEKVCRNNESFIERFFVALDRLKEATNKKYKRKALYAGLLVKKLVDCEKNTLIMSKFSLTKKVQSMQLALSDKAYDFTSKVRKEYNQLSRAVSEKLSKNETVFKESVARLNGASPLKIVAGGYSKVYKEGMSVTSIKGIEIKDKIDIVVKDGVIATTVDKIKRIGKV